MRVLIATGASGGHIFPALSFIDTLKGRYPDTEALLILPKKNFIDQQQLAKYEIRDHAISFLSLRPNSRNLIAGVKFLQGALQSLCVLLEFRPHVVVGFGSLATVPLILFAWVLRIETLIHEQNVVPGQANRLLAIFADKIAVSFAETKDYLKPYVNKISVTGNPVRRDFKKIEKNKALDFFGLSQDKFTVLVMGGSQGSHRLNTAFLKGMSDLKDCSKFQVIHLAGVKDRGFLKEGYAGLNIGARVFGFLKEMPYAYSACDILICRAGATTISEAIFFSTPAMIIPYPFASAHQLKNAQVLEKKGCAIIIQDGELDNFALRQGLQELADNPEKLKDMRYNYNKIERSDAGDLLVSQVISFHV